METYRLETTVTKDGKIILPGKFKKMFAHFVEVIIRDKSKTNNGKALEIPAYYCGGKLKDTRFSREEIYDYRI